MARKLPFGWFASTQRTAQQSLISSHARQSCQRRPLFEMLEARHMLSASSLLNDGALASAPIEQVQANTSAVAHTLWANQEEFEANFEANNAELPAAFTALSPWPDFDPTEDGFQLTYSYSNFLDGTLPGGLTPEELIAGTEEALSLWAANAPLHFVEVIDSGPDPTDPSDGSYSAVGHPHIRIGHHNIDGRNSVLAHAYFPTTSGLAGDVHFDNGDSWGLTPGSGRFDVIEVMLHELGHSLGLGHETTNDAIMRPFIGNRFSGLGTGFLFDDDIAGIQALYGEGEGSVTPLQPLLVDILDDEDDGNTDEGDLSLREAIKKSIADGGKQKISFAESLAGGTIVLDPALGSLILDGGVIIEGLGSGLITVQATDPTPGVANGDGFQIFTISNNPAPGSEDPDTLAKVQISGLTLTGGDSATAGGAIFNTEALELTDVKIMGNHTAERGGAIYTTHLVTLQQSTVEGNSADDDGGGIHTTGGVHLTESTVSGNSSGDEGGGISVEGIGVNSGQEILITSSTISGNTAVGNGGGMHVLDENPTKLIVLHSTVFENHSTGGTGGGIYQHDGVLVLDHSIIAKNTDSSGIAPDLDNVNFLADPVILAKYSFIGNSTGSVINQVEPNQIGISSSPIDPQLDPLADNGGLTLTHKPIETSPVLDSGNPNIPFPVEFDQRGEGFDRIVGGFIDIGALETTGFANTILVDILTDESDGDLTAGDLSLREAIERSNSEGGTDRIQFAPSLAGGTIVLNGALGELLITDSMIIDAVNGLSIGITIDASAADATPSSPGGGIRHFRIDNSDANTRLNVSLLGLTLIGGDVTGDGGAVHSLENLTLDFVTVDGNSATGDGGGVYHKDAKLIISHSTLSNNYAGDDGGGLFSSTDLPDSNLDPDPNPIVGKISNSTFSGNEAGDEGGAIYNFDGQLTIAHTTITKNLADWGDGVVSFGDTATETHVFSSIIAANPNTAGDSGYDPVLNPNQDVVRSRGLAHNSFVSVGYNLVGLGNAFLNFNQTGDIAEIDAPQLGPLADNGGKTQTHAPLAGSPVIDAGDPNLPTRSYGAEALANSPFLYWNLDETLGSTVEDAIGNANGTVGSEVTLNQDGSTSVTGKAASFTGVDEHSLITSDENNLLDTSGWGDNYSVSLWFKADTVSETQVLFTLSEPGNALPFVTQMRWQSSGIIFKGESDVAVSDTSSLATEQWHHVVVVREGLETRIYLNGELDSTESGSGFSIGVDTLLSLGGGPTGEMIGGFDGDIDEFILYDSSLSSQDVGKLFRSATTPPAEILANDQRGVPFDRVADGNSDSIAIVDIGAFEIQTPDPKTDFNNDGDVDGSDFLAWQRGVGKANPTLSDGDANGDGTVDGDDLGAWQEKYGDETPAESHFFAADFFAADSQNYDTIDGLPPLVHHTRPIQRAAYRADAAANDLSFATRHELFASAGRAHESLQRGFNDDLLSDNLLAKEYVFERGSRPAESSHYRRSDRLADVEVRQVTETNDASAATESLDEAFAELLAVGMLLDD